MNQPAPEPENENVPHGARTLGWADVVGGCGGPFLGSIILPVLTAWWYMAAAGNRPHEDVGGPVTLLILLMLAAFFGANIGAVGSNIVRKIVQRRRRKWTRAIGQGEEDWTGGRD